MTTELPPLTGAYPVVGIVTDTSSDGVSCGWGLIASDATGSEIIESGAGVAGVELRRNLAEFALLHAQQRHALVRTWSKSIAKQVHEVGGSDYLDVAINAVADDAYRAARDIAIALWHEHASKTKPSPLVIAVDGSRSRNGDGSWAWINEYGRWDAQAGRYTSILIAEMEGILNAIRAHKGTRPLHILCDSKFAISLAQDALAGVPAGEHVSNGAARVMGLIARAGEGRTITIEWVKGHNGHPLNDRADRLAVHARRARDLAGTDAFLEVANRVADLSEDVVAA